MEWAINRNEKELVRRKNLKLELFGRVSERRDKDTKKQPLTEANFFFKHKENLKHKGQRNRVFWSKL
jgi:hypothetical protein